MEQPKQTNVWPIWEMAQKDPQYAQMLKQLGELEQRYEEVLQTLPTEQQDVICDFVSQCEAMSWRMLEIACEERKKPEA